MDLIKIINYLSCVFTLNYVVVVAIFIRGWYRLKYYRPNEVRAVTPVSVIIAARNEENKIAATIEDILRQNFPKNLLEIIIIDDHSSDRTADIIRSYEDQGVKLIQLNEDRAINSYKKKAIQTAICIASGKLIVTTDADCSMQSNWLATIVNYYQTKGYKMISSPVTYFQEKNCFDYAQTLEFSYLIGLGASTIGNQIPGTCNGANLAYEKEAFYEVGGFKGIDDLASGDDELLLHKMAVKYKGKIGFLKNYEAVVFTHGKKTLSEFIQQRKRWASKSTRYKNKTVVVLGISIWAFNLLIIVNLLLGLIFLKSIDIQFFVWQLIGKILIEVVFLFGVTKFFRRKRLILLLPIISFLHVIYMIYIGIAGNSGKYDWKGRMVN